VIQLCQSRVTVNEFADYVIICVAFASKLGKFTLRLVLDLDGLYLVQFASTVVTVAPRGL
jgi:hypothetical protein